MVDPTYPLFPVFAFLGIVLTIIPLPWHLEAWNSATCYYMLWTSLSCLNEFVNTVVWAHDAIDHAPLWCEICKFTFFVMKRMLILCSLFQLHDLLLPRLWASLPQQCASTSGYTVFLAYKP